MFSLTDATSVRRNPLAARALIRYFSTADLYALYSTARVDERHPLDDSLIHEDVLNGSDEGKKLVLALFAPSNADEILRLSGVSSEHACAILSNPRIDWYTILDENDIVRSQLLVPAVLAGDARSDVLLRNPRMDRRFIAEMIYGQSEFKDEPLDVRFERGLTALEAQYIASPRYHGKQLPEGNELWFWDPVNAFLSLLRDLLRDRPYDGRRLFLTD